MIEDERRKEVFIHAPSRFFGLGREENADRIHARHLSVTRNGGGGGHACLVHYSAKSLMIFHGNLSNIGVGKCP
jgi:hypothetical protein